MNNTVMTSVLLIVLMIAVIIAGPLLALWSLNTLFPALAIPYNVWTWLAALILAAQFHVRRK